MEIGPGSGNFLAQAIEAKYDVDAVEDSNIFTEKIKRRLNIKIRNGRFENQDFNGLKYNAYLSFHVIEHVPDIIYHLEKAHEVTNLDGYAFIATPNANSWEHKIASLLSPNYCTSHMHLFTEKSLTLCLNQAGWDVIKVFTPSYTSSWPRVFTSFYRRYNKKQSSSSGGEYIRSTSQKILLAIKLFKIISRPFRLIQEYLKGGNVLFIVARVKFHQQ